ncbi:MAG TPA: NAD-dependent epimerase/dehydratase family protein [Fibrobacteria bacterium]|nr:NAD-dependent epimerase/dehydratase family protein [Fibrobacteria bacterium]
MKVLITGGAGFIGSHLAERYLKQGDEVFVLDDFSTGSMENIRHLDGAPEFSGRFHHTRGSILDRETLLELVGICDVAVHLAAAVGVQYILDNPLSSMVTNTHGTETVLELCNKFRKKVLLASTSEVYGKHDHAPLLETDDCIYGSSDKFRWSYAASKLMDEFMGLAYHRKNGLPVLVVRFFNTVGPRQTGRYGMVIPRFVKQALNHEPLTVYGDGRQTRTFTHVEDVVDALVALIAAPGAVGQVVNIGGVEEVSMLDLARRIVAVTGSRSEIRLIPYDEAFPPDFEDMRRRVPSTAKLQGLTGKSPRSDLDRILRDVVGFFRSVPGGTFA